MKVTSKGSTKIELSVTGARQGTPFWLVLGESNNAGWEATVDGKNIGGSTLVDGYANGWLVHPRSGAFAVTLRVDAAAEGVDRARRCRRSRCSCACSSRCAAAAGLRRRRPDDEPDDAPALASPLVATGRRPRALVGRGWCARQSA